ncbi:MAG TPA: cell division protein ZipA C-terminal FtsZ-binding domain-containing protein [Gammaproteobacteria bacterium]|nr:cell division protein ZipA C-terminal FtsZ-binding domain-containing protein [Gammaproteobacteria bacterium]
MDILRWILLVFGLLLIAAVYFTGRRGEPDSLQRRAPGFDDSRRPYHEEDGDNDPTEPDEYETDTDDAGDDDSGSQEEASFDFERLLADDKDGAAPAPSRSVGKSGRHSMLLEDEFVVVHLMVPSISSLSGSRLYSALHELGFDLEEDAIFHYRESDCPLLVVNMFKPGTFPGEPDDFTSKGISFILRLSRTHRPLDAFDEMIALAYELKSMLNLQLFDMQRSSLTKQTIAFIEEEVGEYQRRRGL